MESRTVESSRGNRGPALLEAARELFFVRGFAGTTMEQVARKAGLSKRSVYLYFKNKDELFITVASQGISLFHERLKKLDIASTQVEQLILETTNLYLDFAHDEPEYFRIIFRDTTNEMMERASPELRAKVAQQERSCLGVVAKIVERGIQENVIPPVNPMETAIIFWGTVTGIILLSLGGSQTVIGHKARQEVITKAVLTLFAGLKATQSSGEDET